MLKPQDLMGHTTIGTAKNDANIPLRSVASFQRTRDPKARDIHNILLLLPPNNQVCEGLNQLRHVHKIQVFRSTARLSQRVPHPKIFLMITGSSQTP